jgi:hypothetical protein
VEEVHTGFDFEQSPQAPAEPASSGGPRQRTGSLPSSP